MTQLRSLDSKFQTPPSFVVLTIPVLRTRQTCVHTLIVWVVCLLYTHTDLKTLMWDGGVWSPSRRSGDDGPVSPNVVAGVGKTKRKIYRRQNGRVQLFGRSKRKRISTSSRCDDKKLIAPNRSGDGGAKSNKYFFPLQLFPSFKLFLNFVCPTVYNQHNQWCWAPVVESANDVRMLPIKG